MPTDNGQSLLVLIGLICAVPLALFIGMAWLIYRHGAQWLESWFEPDPQKLHTQLVSLRQKRPDATTDQLVRQIIQRQALRAGVVGALTGIGGFWTLPVALPVDLALSYQIQATLVSFIAYLYQGDASNDTTQAKIRTYLVMTGSSKATQTTTNFLMRLAVRVAGKSFAKVIPFVGALISFAVNYLIVQLMGHAAARWYAQQQQRHTPQELPQHIV